MYETRGAIKFLATTPEQKKAATDFFKQQVSPDRVYSMPIVSSNLARLPCIVPLHTTLTEMPKKTQLNTDGMEPDVMDLDQPSAPDVDIETGADRVFFKLVRKNPGVQRGSERVATRLRGCNDRGDKIHRRHS